MLIKICNTWFLGLCVSHWFWTVDKSKIVSSAKLCVENGPCPYARYAPEHVAKHADGNSGSSYHIRILDLHNVDCWS